ncbi:MAG: thioredoxin family protein [Bacteroidales bacterium]
MMYPKMKTGIITVAFLFFTVNLTATHRESSEKGISFTDKTYESALQMAKESNKVVFMAFHAEWCGFCTKLKENTFPDEQVGKLFNQYFINLSVDIEKGEGVSLKEKYNVNRYPTLIFVTPEGEIIKESRGYKKPDKMMGLAQEVLNL